MKKYGLFIDEEKIFTSTDLVEVLEEYYNEIGEYDEVVFSDMRTNNFYYACVASGDTLTNIYVKPIFE